MTEFLLFLGVNADLYHRDEYHVKVACCANARTLFHLKIKLPLSKNPILLNKYVGRIDPILVGQRHESYKVLY
jgi:hypothetical protein